MGAPAPKQTLSVVPAVRDALAYDIFWSWPGGVLRYDGPTHDGHIFWIQAHNWNYRLVVGHHATLRAETLDDPSDLIEALREQRWMEFLLEHTCGFVALVAGGYLLRRCSAAKPGDGGSGAA
jgi:hypothetical protein